jgi:hypothetical protein
MVGDDVLAATVGRTGHKRRSKSRCIRTLAHSSSKGPERRNTINAEVVFGKFRMETLVHQFPRWIVAREGQRFVPSSIERNERGELRQVNFDECGNEGEN